ncbi:MAG: carbamate kinase [Lachnospiraceae bacterium]|nr:carbamate kinase [Lachnospiraceae bacterium]
MSKKKVVVALGHKALGTTLPEQKVATKAAAKAIADLVEAGCQVVISHSNAPQVGMIHTAMNEFGKQHPGYTFAPMSVCSAMSQGYIGYDLQNAIREELLDRGIDRPVSTILTQVVVNPYDDSFYKPVKVVGRVMSREEADAEEEKGNYVTKVEGGYRRIVSAPKPEDIVEIESIRVLSDAGHVVIACGGGGIPVLRQSHHLKGASAVIEKDLASGKLAELLDADMLLLLTSEKKLYLNYGKENAEPLEALSVEKAHAYIAEGQFDETSVLPKVVAAVSFVSLRPGRVTVIADLDDAKEALEERAGTIIR